MTDTKRIEGAYELAKESYAKLGVDTDKVISKMDEVSISLQCWQGDDVGGFEKPDSVLGGGGIQVTGNYPGKARTVSELRADLKKALSLIPGKHRVNLHAIYGEFGGKLVDRNEIDVQHYQGWIDWAKQENLKLDFNATCFSHPKANDGYTLSSKNKEIRDFWIEHAKRCRKITAHMGKELKSPSVHNLWIPDGGKDTPVDKYGYRALLKDSLDKIYSTDYSSTEMKDAVESKLFGIGSESFVVGSHEFYMAYAIAKKKMICLDMGHFHPTESIADKISSVLQFSDELLLHISRGVRWDSDHVVIFNDELKALTEEIIRSNALNRVNIGLDFFDASINRVGAYVVGTRATLKAFMYALLEPIKILREYEDNGRLFERLALLEELRTMPFGSVWNYYCMKKDTIPGESFIQDIQSYEKEVLSKRG